MVPFWLNLLPLKSDCAETRYAHEQFCRMVERCWKLESFSFSILIQYLLLIASLLWNTRAAKQKLLTITFYFAFRLDDDLLGPNNENLPKVLEVLREVMISSKTLFSLLVFMIIWFHFHICISVGKIFLADFVT